MAQNTFYNATDLQFSGSVSASISHEMKNVLAIVNEMMGLLDDLSRMAKAGRALDLERLQNIASRMKTQIERGDGIMRSLNRFAHSIDRDAETLDLADVVSFVARLAQRRAALRDVTLTTMVPQEAFRITTNFFALTHLIWDCLESAAALAGAGATLVLGVQKGPHGPCVHVSGIQPSNSADWADFPDSHVAALAVRLGARVTHNPMAGELTLNLPTACSA